MDTGQLAQSENVLRAALYSAHTYAIRKQVVAGVRCQSDGHVVQIYARNMDQVYNPASFTSPPVYDMKAVEGVEPAKLPDPFRVTTADVGVYGLRNDFRSGDIRARWIGPTGGPSAGYYAAPEWLGGEHPWFVFPVVLFNAEGRVILAECKFHYSTNPADGWYPTMDGAFGAVCDNATNSNRMANGVYYTEPLKYTNQVLLSGWRCNSYKGTGSHDVPVESPSMTAAPYIFNYAMFRGVYSWNGSRGPFDYGSLPSEALNRLKEVEGVILGNGTICRLDVNTGMLVRTRAYQRIQGN